MVNSRWHTGISLNLQPRKNKLKGKCVIPASIISMGHAQQHAPVLPPKSSSFGGSVPTFCIPPPDPKLNPNRQGRCAQLRVRARDEFQFVSWRRGLCLFLLADDLHVLGGRPSSNYSCDLRCCKSQFSSYCRAPLLESARAISYMGRTPVASV